jgi:hypothetical protein
MGVSVRWTAPHSGDLDAHGMGASAASWLSQPFEQTWVERGATDSSRLRAPFLNRRLIHALQSVLREVPASGALDSKPVVVQCRAPLPPRLRFYVYAVTTSYAERQEGAHRVQLTNAIPLPGRPGRYQFDHSDEAQPVLAGYAQEWDAFVLWDAGLHDLVNGFPPSKGVQVTEDTILKALSREFATQSRRLRPGGRTMTETVVAVRASNLIAALEERFRLTRAALLEY